MTAQKTIFGFGSLINTASLLATAPNATNITPAYIKGFTRTFSFWDAIGYTETNIDCIGEPMCALDVTQARNKDARVNGVTFTVDAADFKKLLVREDGYDVIATAAYNYFSDELIIAECLVFSANKNNGKYVFDGKAQQRYLEDFLNAARLHGEKYYQEALDTTFIENLPIRQVEKLSKYC